jgi:hypothetical protein
MGRAKKKARIRTVSTAGTPMIQNELTPVSRASSADTKVDVAPNQEAARDK